MKKGRDSFELSATDLVGYLNCHHLAGLDREVADDAPREIEFLYSLNRLNVATSRAKCVSILVGSPQISEAECRTLRQIQLANAFCRYLEMAKCTSSA